jgi:hypothetical protein
MERKTPDAVQSRVELDADMLSRFSENIYQGNLSKLVHERGLPYSLVYNLAHGRIRSLSRRDYRIIFGEDPPGQAVQRVDGVLFRGSTKADLYRKLFAGKPFKKVDYRIFTGEVRTVDARLEELMKENFLNQGLEWAEVREWIEELDQVDEGKRVSYSSIKPVLEYLERHLEVSSSRVLNQCAYRYESGELKTVPKEVYDCALRLKTRTGKALRSGSRFQLEKLKEDIYGKRKRLTLYAHIREEVRFLRKYGGKTPGRYLGRSASKYEKLHLKRVASWRAEKIREDTLGLIKERPEIPVMSLPSVYRRMYFAGLLSAVRRMAGMRMMEEKDRSLEEEVLTPSFTKTEALPGERDNRVRVDQSAQFLGMSKKAFDLMVGANSHIFRKVAIYDGGWYLPGRYLQELGAKKDFALVRAKYKLLARETSR